MMQMKKRIIKHILFCAIFGLFTLPCYALMDVYQQKDSTIIRYDESTINLREFSSEKLDEFKDDSRFDYGNRPPVKLNFLERIFRWIAELIAKLTQYTAGNQWLKIVFYILLAGVIIFAVLKIMGVDINKTIYRQIDKGTLPFDILDENIHELDFEKLIQEAIDRNEFKKAIRLYYLFALKKLADKELIHWHPGKTNHAYQSELKEKTIKPSFDDLGYYFDYAWYGDFNISQGLFAKVKGIFSDFKKAVESHGP